MGTLRFAHPTGLRDASGVNIGARFLMSLEGVRGESLDVKALYAGPCPIKKSRGGARRAQVSHLDSR